MLISGRSCVVFGGTYALICIWRPRSISIVLIETCISVVILANGVQSQFDEMIAFDFVFGQDI